mmetsp:Transcript_14534/g.37689  ORF Transcript_14534/g.37689 Transcript_14534/m.37689 type:complete len:111 (-) Transcript_14534:62-394(-)
MLARMLAFIDDLFFAAAAGTAGRRVGMCANMYEYEEGGAFTYATDQERATRWPEGTLMHSHAQLHAERVERARRQAQQKADDAASGAAARRRSSTGTLAHAAGRVARASH